MLNTAHSSTALRCPELSVRAKTDPSCSNFITVRVGTPCRSSAWASHPGGLSQHTGLLKASALFSPNMFCILQSCRKGQIIRPCLNPHLHSGSFQNGREFFKNAPGLLSWPSLSIHFTQLPLPWGSFSGQASPALPAAPPG